MRALAIAGLVFFLMLPFLDLWLFRRHVRLQALGAHRKRYYAELLAELWIPAGAVLFGAVASGLPPRAIGLGGLRLEEELLPRWLSLVVVALALALIVYSGFDLVRLGRSSSYRASVNRRLRSGDAPSSVRAIMPATRAERVLYAAVALSAGITEEILYRGFLVFVLAAGLPALGIWGSVLVSSALFALGHLYQGPSGMLRTLVIGLVMGLVYLASETLVLGMLIHVLIDAVGVVLRPSDDLPHDAVGA